MKHFVVEATYSAPIERVGEAYARHRAWLQKGYDLGLFLCSGPKDPPTGGYLVARAESAEALRTMFEEEPFNRGGAGDIHLHRVPTRQAAALDRGMVWRTGGQTHGTTN